MALTGRWDRIELIDTDETQTIAITYPEDLSADDPNYSKRGTVVDEELPVQSYETTIFEDVYLMVNKFTVYNSIGPDTNGEDTKLSVVRFNYRVFVNPEERLVDYNNPIHEGSLETRCEGVENHSAHIYNFLKTNPGFTNLIDA